jgi:hypothetical protein
MAFPATYNFNYYRGDTHEFKIYPKNSDGSTFNLSGYGNATFKISTTRGTSGVSSQVSGYANINAAGGYVSCAIAKDYGSDSLSAGTQYVFDIQIRKSNTPYDLIHTLLTGTITVTDDVTQGIGESN